MFTDAGKLTPPPPRLRCTAEHGPGIVVPPLRRVVRSAAITGTGCRDCRAMGNYFLNCEHQPLYNFLNISAGWLVTVYVKSLVIFIYCPDDTYDLVLEKVPSEDS